jgi:hypothetical protein
MAKFASTDLVDIHMTVDGDLELSADGDFKFSVNSQAVIDNILFRLKTYKGDWLLGPECGASLEKFMGEPNNSETGELIERYAYNALTHDGFLSDNELNLDAIPIDRNTVSLFVEAVYNDEPISLVANLELREGQITLVM